MKIAIMSDSATGFTLKEMKKYADITIVPLIIIENNTTVYQDDEKEITQAQLRAKMIKDKYEIKTSQTNKEMLRQYWLKLLTKVDQILFLPIAKAASGQYDMALSLAKTTEFINKVHVYETGAADLPLKFMVYIAHKLVSIGKSIPEITQILDQVRRDYDCYISPYTLKYLTKGGRAPAAIVSLGSFLRIKAIIKCKETIEKATVKMTHNGVLEEMIKRIVENARQRNINIIDYPLYVINGFCSSKLIEEAIIKAKRYGFKKIQVSNLCNILNAHTFKDTIGYAVFPNEIIKELPNIE